VNTSVKWGLALGVVLGLVDIAGLAGLGVDNGPPPALVIGSAVLGVITIAAVAVHRRRGAIATVIATRVLSALLGLPVYWADNAPGWAKVAVGIALALTVVAVALLTGGRGARVAATPERAR
jgi:peptidoglycan/LPS O-acetylase OafA/YrhL